MNKQEMDILYYLYQEPFISQRIVAERSRHSLGVVNRSIKELIHNGYLDEHIQLTLKAREKFRTQKPKNAVILAAGTGMRMVPIHMAVPKALLEVNGERLIERLIVQLQQAGVYDITVVAGFMKETMEYLIDEFGVKLVYNDLYAVRNNISSLDLVADQISNTYIVPCDIWCDRSPFRRHELYSWYMVSDFVDEMSDVRVNRKMELVKTSSDDAGNGMIGIAYLTEEQAVTVRNKIKLFARDKKYDDKFWEEALYLSDRMIVQARVVHAEEVVEINTYEQLRDLDSASKHLQSDALNKIAEQLECKITDISDIETVKKGMTNRSFLFSLNGQKYIMRIPGAGTDRLIDRVHEAQVYEQISGYQLCEDPVYINPENGYKLTRYIQNARSCDPGNIDDIKMCMKKLRKFHSLKLRVSHKFDIFGQIDFYESLWKGQTSIFKDYQRTKEHVFELRDFIEKHCGELQLTHIDAVPDNFLFDSDAEGELSVQLIDWEYAGMQDKHVDIAMFCIYSLYDKAGTDRLIDIYFEDEGGCSETVRTKIYCYIAACGLLWSNWCEYKRGLGIEFGEYSLRQYRFAKDYYHYALKMMQETSEGTEEWG